MSAPSDADPAALAGPLSAASFVRVAAAADGDALAASGLVAAGLRAAATPFQVRVRDDPTGGGIDDRDGTDAAAGDPGFDGLVFGVGTAGGDYALSTRPASAAAFDLARALGATPDPVVALAGVVADGGDPDASEASGASEAIDAIDAIDGATRRPGVGVPVADLGDGLAHSTLLHGPLSGDVDAARATLAELGLPAEPDDDARRRLASLVAVDVATDEGAAPSAATAVGRALRPHVASACPFATVEGFADVLDAVARERPGAGVALALGDGHDGVRAAALEAWREHARAAHRALRGATIARHDRVVVVRPTVGRPAVRLPTVARLCLAFRSPEPAVLAVADAGTGVPPADSDGAGDGVDGRPAVDDGADGYERVAALAVRDRDDAAAVVRAVVAGIDGPATGYGAGWRGGVRFDADADAVVDATREVLS